MYSHQSKLVTSFFEWFGPDVQLIVEATSNDTMKVMSNSIYIIYNCINNT